ncbi:MAG: Crp/Fnr family transcriptional regulator [Caldilineales bacterium]|nr:Crp/Fnr family transcriptional regulator [Caldilineales bacterium]
MSSTASILQLLPDIPYFRDQSEEVLLALAATASQQKYGEGAVIFLEGEPVSGLFLIEAGTVKISRVSREGREYILHLIGAGDTFNDVAVLDGGPNPATATAYTDVRVWCIKRDDLKRIAGLYPELNWAFVESIARRARHLMGVVEDLSMRSVRGRLAHLLLEQAKAFEGDEVPRMLTQEEMASRLGTVREMVGRALRALASDGIIEFDRHRIVVVDPERLAEEAEA